MASATSSTITTIDSLVGTSESTDSWDFLFGHQTMNGSQFPRNVFHEIFLIKSISRKIISSTPPAYPMIHTAGIPATGIATPSFAFERRLNDYKSPFERGMPRADPSSSNPSKKCLKSTDGPELPLNLTRLPPAEPGGPSIVVPSSCAPSPYCPSDITFDKPIRDFAEKSQKDDTKKETIIYAVTRCDPSLSCAFRKKEMNDLIMQLAEKRRLVFKRVTSPNEIRELIEKEEDGRISTIIIGAHGTPDTINLCGKDIDGAELTKGWNLKHFKRGAEVILDACSTAGKPEKSALNFAEQVHRHVGSIATVVAPRVSASAWRTTRFRDTLVFWDQGKEVWERGENATVRLRVSEAAAIENPLKGAE